MENFDVVVVGTGGVGSASLYHLAKRGLRVLGLDQFHQAHAKGSSHGETRIIRQAYFEHPDYVPLLLRAYTLWREVEQETGGQLFHQVGLLEVGPDDGMLIPGVMQSVSRHGLPIERLSPAEARQRFSLMIPDEMQVVFEPTAGYLLVEPCVQSHLDLAERSGAVWRQQAVVDWRASRSEVTVVTASDTYQASCMVVAAGAWSRQLLAGLGVPLRVVPKHQYWFASSDVNIASSLPTYFYEVPEGCFYGFPDIRGLGLGMKVARHSGGEPTDGPVELSELSDAEDEMAVRRFAGTHLPAASAKLLSRQACMYTLSPDEHFVIGPHPQHANVVLACGLSGHGFKFTAVLGEVLADLAMGIETDFEIDFLGTTRFAR